MADPFIGQIMPIAFQYAPIDWAFCNGSLMPLQQNMALYSLIGIRFGGNGATTFGLPNLRGRIPIGSGQGPGLTNRQWAETGGAETVRLTENQIMAHTHRAVANDSANRVNPTGMIWGGDTTGTNPYYSSTAPKSSNILSSTAIATAGGLNNGTARSHDNLPPVLGLHYIICLHGSYPGRE